MANQHERDEQALLAASLRRKRMAIAQIARYMGTSERQVYRHLARAQHLYRLFVTEFDSKKSIGETLTVFEEMEREALEKFARANPHSNVAVAYLNAARDARKEIKKLLQEAGMITKVAEKLEVSGLPLHKDKVRDALLGALELAHEEGEGGDVDA